MHEGAFGRQRMMIWGQTYPELSVKYTETVCTGAVFVDGPGLVRIYPIPLRHLTEEERHKKWQFIEADVERSPRDSRPESCRIRQGTIEAGRRLEADDAGVEERRKLLLRPEHMVEGLSHIERLQRESRLSLGIVRPHEVEFYVQRVAPGEIQARWQRYREITSQTDLWPVGGKPVPPIEYQPRVRFRGPGDSEVHDRMVLDWEFVQTTRRAVQSLPFPKPTQDQATKALHEWIAPPLAHKEVFLVLGNISSHPQVFVVVGVVYLRKVSQPSLF